MYPRFSVSRNNYEVLRLGSKYGGWHVVIEPSLVGGNFISAGLGEDASFDLEFIKKFSTSVILVDPTPRAILHFHEIQNKLNSCPTESYSLTGRQSVNSYDLRGITKNQISLIAKALWIHSGRLRFFEPSEESHVSYSITNIQNKKSLSTSYIEVDGVTIWDIVKEFNFSHIDLLKLDIEGAECDVVESMINENIFPTQLLVEYDELNFPTFATRRRIIEIDVMLKKNGYTLAFLEKPSNFTYYRDPRHHPR